MQINIKDPKTGNSYTLEYTRKTVEMMERSGFNINEFMEMDKPLTQVLTMFSGAFLAHHQQVKKEKIEEIFRRIGNKEKLIGTLMEMYNEPLNALMAEPDEGDEGNMVWTAG